MPLLPPLLAEVADEPAVAEMRLQRLPMVTLVLLVGVASCGRQNGDEQVTKWSDVTREVKVSGRCGRPFGALFLVAGALSDQKADVPESGRYFEVDTVNGERLQVPVRFALADVERVESAPKDEGIASRRTWIAYENGDFQVSKASADSTVTDAESDVVLEARPTLYLCYKADKLPLSRAAAPSGGDKRRTISWEKLFPRLIVGRLGAPLGTRLRVQGQWEKLLPEGKWKDPREKYEFHVHAVDGKETTEISFLLSEMSRLGDAGLEELPQVRQRGLPTARSGLSR